MILSAGTTTTQGIIVVIVLAPLRASDEDDLGNDEKANCDEVKSVVKANCPAS